MLARNFRRRGCELDIVAERGTTLLVVEVKRRERDPGAGLDLEALLGARKRQALQRGVGVFLGESPGAWGTIRLDLAVVISNGDRAEVRWFCDAVDLNA